MAKVPIHFTGFLANVGDDSITKLQLGDGFTIESDPPSIESDYPSDLMPFFRLIDYYWGLRGRDDISPEGSYRVVKRNIAEFEDTDDSSLAICSGVCVKAHTFVESKLRLLRLFKEGNAVLAYSFLHHVRQSEIASLGAIGDHVIADRTPLTLTPAEIPQAQLFVDTISLPLREPLQLALESFELSYRTYDIGLAFLSLMIAMEVLLGPKDHQEITYRISRNAAVLLGSNRAEAEKVFKDMKDLYTKRSKIVHESKKATVTQGDTLRLRSYVRETLKEVMRIGGTKEDMLTILNRSGFGERPWRTDQ